MEECDCDMQGFDRACVKKWFLPTKHGQRAVAGVKSE